MRYGDYLKLDGLLGCQQPVSDQHDEMLFIVIHQATELWMKAGLHELDGAIATIQGDDLSRAFKMLSRFSRIQSQLIQSWDVLSTLTPADYLTFRGKLGSASGLQSLQYRLIECRLGARSPGLVDRHADDPDAAEALRAALAVPSIYDVSVTKLAQRGFAIAPACLERDLAQPHALDGTVVDAWMAVYRDPEQYWDLYELAEKLVDVADWFQQWRFRHLTTVARIIGDKSGTGGTSGVAYLRRALDHRFFPELWEVRTRL